jgi:hypothetical protein
MDSAAMADSGLDGPSVTDPAEKPSAKPAANRLDRLKKKREQVNQEREPLKLQIPEYGDELVAAYRVLNFEELNKLLERGEAMTAQGDPRAKFKVSCDTIAAACVGFYTLDENGEEIPLNEIDESLGEEPITYKDKLAEALGVETRKVRELIEEIFPTDLSIMAHLGEISRWMESNRESDDADF